MATDTRHNAECTGWHRTSDSEDRCLACNPKGDNPSGPPPWHTGPWMVDGVPFKFTVTSVTVCRGEGPSDLCVTKTYATIDEATLALKVAKPTYPTGGGYDKHDVKITWDDGETYEARLDCANRDDDDCDIRAHAVDFLRLHAGLNRPAHLTPERYAAFLRDSHRVNGTTAADYTAYIARFA